MAVALFFLIKTTPCFSKKNPLGEHILEDRNAQWQIMADRMSYSLKDTLYIAEGHVTITRSGQVLSAEKAIYNKGTGIVQVTGHVRLEANGDLFTGETGIFDLKNHYGQITRAHIFLRENNVHIRGDSMTRLGPNTYVVRGCRVTTCDGDTPDWSVTGAKIKVTLEGYGQIRHAAFRIRNFPVFYIPYAIFPVKTKRQTGFLPPRLGYSGRNGFDIEIPFFWAISDQTDATFYERYLTKRGFMQGLEYRYLTKDDSNGVFLFDILSDKIAPKDFENPDQAGLSPFERTNETRYWMRSRTDQKLPGGLDARLDMDFVSDQDYLKEFRGALYGFQARPDLGEISGRPVEEIYSPTRRSALRLSRDGDEYSLQALGSYHQRPENPSYDHTPQPLLGLNFTTLSRQPFSFPLYVGVDAEYDYIWREMGQKGNSLTLSPDVSYPIRLGRYAEMEQSLALFLNSQWLDTSHDGEDQISRRAYESKTRISTVMERIFDFRWNDTRKLKHKIVPSLTYTYRGYHEGDTYQPWFESIDEIGKVNKITFAIENLLDARNEDDKGAVSYAQWGTFALSQSYNIDESRRDGEPWREKRPFDPLEGILTFTPFPDLNFEAEAHWDHYESQISFSDLSLELTVRRSGGRFDTFEIDYLYEKDVSNSLNYRFNINLDYGFAVGSSLTRDFDRQETLGRSYWIDYTSQCWAVRLVAENLDDVSSFMIYFRILGIGGLGNL